MKEYHKIETVWQRNPETKFRTLLEGQYANETFAYLAENAWVYTEKVDGTNIRVMVSPPRPEGRAVTFGGKTDAALIPAFLVERLQEQFLPIQTRERLYEAFPDGGCLYGEGYGAKIQKGGGNYRRDQGFVLFDVKVGEWWLQRHDVQEVAYKFDLDTVPEIGRGTLPDMIAMARAGITSAWGDFPAEGIVARPEVELKARNGGRIITKIKTKDFQP